MMKNMNSKTGLSLKTTPLLEDLILSGAFVGDHYKWTHPTQNCFLLGYKNQHSFYRLSSVIAMFDRATKFLKLASQSRETEFIFVGNSPGGLKISSYLFERMNLHYFPNFGWKAGFISQRENRSNVVLVICNLVKNIPAYREGVKSNVPVVGFLSPDCPVVGVDYPVCLNLLNNRLWFTYYCLGLMKSRRLFFKHQKSVKPRLGFTKPEGSRPTESLINPAIRGQRELKGDLDLDPRMSKFLKKDQSQRQRFRSTQIGISPKKPTLLGKTSVKIDPTLTKIKLENPKLKNTQALPNQEKAQRKRGQTLLKKEEDLRKKG